jgi:hypothetical protein
MFGNKRFKNRPEIKAVKKEPVLPYVPYRPIESVNPKPKPKPKPPVVKPPKTPNTPE